MPSKLVEVIVVLAAIAIGAVLLAVAGKRRRFDDVRLPIANDFRLFRRVQVKRIPADEEVTAEATTAGSTYDAADDLMDPSNRSHAQWIADHPAPVDEPPAS